jgi:hypothetical protein
VVVVLTIVGLLLILFGGLVLLRFPDRPGGKITWQGVEVSSPSAGLPVIALGLIAIGAAYILPGQPPIPPPPGSTPKEVSASVTLTAELASCLDSYFADVPAERTKTVEEGSLALEVLSPGLSIGAPIVLKLTDQGKSVGAIRFHLVKQGQDELFKADDIVDAKCTPLREDDYANATRGGDPRVLQNFDSWDLRFSERHYELRLGDGAGITASFRALPAT